MQTFAPTETVTAADLTVRLPSVAELAPLPLETSPLTGGTSFVRLALPASTPPGTYDGTMRLGAKSVPIVAEVEPYVSLRLAPAQLQFEAAPGAEVTAHVTVFNDGNVPLELGSAHAFGLYDTTAAERSIRVALTATVAPGERRVDRLVDELADGHGGLMRVKVAEGAGMLEPAGVAQLELLFRVADALEPGRTYSGTWPLHNVRYYVRVVVPAEQKPRRATSRGRTR
jgi:hypothetical protein